MPFLFFLGLFLATNALFANTIYLGVFAGGNYFAKTERPGFKLYNNNPYGYGAYIVDDNGFSAHAGLRISIGERWSIEATYRFPRFSSYVYAATITPYVYGPNTYFTESMSTSWTLAAKFYLDKVNKFSPFLGFGLDLARVEAYHTVGFIHPETFIISYIYPEDHLGVRHALGVFVPFGTDFSITDHFLLNASINYTLMQIPVWGDDFPMADDQNLSGFYFNVNLVYNI